MKPEKPLGRPAYGSIAHLPGSKEGVGDKRITPGQAKIMWEKTRDRHDIVIVQEKIDGSCCSVANIEGHIIALTRAGYLAETSEFEQHHLFQNWVAKNDHNWSSILKPGERMVGEWIAQAHGTKYADVCVPFIAFDLFRGSERVSLDEYEERVLKSIETPHVFHRGSAAFPLLSMKEVIRAGSKHGGEEMEGVVYRVYRKGVFDYAAKYVRGDYQAGKYLKGITGHEDVWNWRPSDGA